MTSYKQLLVGVYVVNSLFSSSLFQVWGSKGFVKFDFPPTNIHEPHALFLKTINSFERQIIDSLQFLSRFFPKFYLLN